ncbi:LysR family transcriptional regulator [Rhizorhapis sp.]|uniref:LysR family transcriptional regulator n=1 Tax=Rhizorhapis sp. TaxID=1968842 RepID=UPI002B467F3A|nr:LysR family transcriptional regulator [Rhizorhapis sp.]HKR17138.1 LysR family transcriptional regulator [Rhizorhapis sp.]
MLDPDSLRAFVAVAELEHFVRAADRLGIAQSVVSKRLKRLEDQIGTRLIERGKRNKVALTRSGELFLPEARNGIAALDRTEWLGRQFGRGAAGPIRIGYVFSAIMSSVLPDLIRLLRRCLPEIEVQPVSFETPEQISAVHEGKIDIGIIRPRPTYPEGVFARTIHEEGVVVALAPDHPLARLPALRAHDIAAHRIIVPQFHEEVGLIDIIRGIAKTAGSPLPPIQRTSDFITAAGLAASGVGIAIAPKSLARLDLQNLLFRDIVDHEARLALVLIVRTDIPPAIGEALSWLPTAD